MANVLFKRGDTATINGTAISDGQLLYNITTGQHYIDSGSTRKEVGKPVDIALSTTSHNAIENQAVRNAIVNTNTTTVAGFMADARQLNPEIADTLAYQVKLQQVRSTSERIVGKDTDGKTMYEKTYSWTPTALGSTSVASGISNIFKMWINPEMSYVVYGGNYRTSAWIAGIPTEGNSMSCSAGNINLYLGTSLALASATNAQATIRYTKTV